MQSWNAAFFLFFFVGYSLGGGGGGGFSGRVRALNLTVPLGSGRVGSDNLGYGPGSGFSFEPVQTSNTYTCFAINPQNPLPQKHWSFLQSSLFCLIFSATAWHQDLRGPAHIRRPESSRARVRQGAGSVLYRHRQSGWGRYAASSSLWCNEQSYLPGTKIHL